MHQGWKVPVSQLDKIKRIGARFKNLRRVFKACHAQLYNLNATIKSNKIMIFFLDFLEEYRDLSLEEWNFSY
jgi:hypothetical protein